MRVELSDRKLNFLTKRGKNLTVAADSNFPHSTVMFSHSIRRAAFPPFLIIQGNTETSDLRDLLRIEGLYIAINPSSWMIELINVCFMACYLPLIRNINCPSSAHFFLIRQIKKTTFCEKKIQIK